MADAKREIMYTHEAPWLIYALSWSNSDLPQNAFRLAIGSFVEEYANKVQIVQLDSETGTFVERGSFEHPYPPTKLAWRPGPDQLGSKDLLATTGDYLRLWEIKEDSTRVEMHCDVFNSNKSSEFCAPLTSFDWNPHDVNIIGTSSIDTSCTIWDLERHEPKTQLIAHDKEVYDIAFSRRDKEVFASSGADGSVRMFDLRHLEHSTIIYECQKPLLRLSWNKQDPNYIATIPLDSYETVILDIRSPTIPIAKLAGHGACVNAIAWAPHSSGHICTAGDDRQALIWDLSQMPKSISDPILAYTSDAEVNQLQWSELQPDWVAIAFDRRMQILRV